MGISTSCRNCAHESKDAYDAPCRGCWNPFGAIYTRWEPKVAHIPIIERPAEPARGPYSDTAIKAVEALVDKVAEAAKPTQVAGRKDDSGKLDVTLFFDDLPNAIEAVTEVLQWAVTKKQPVPYERGSWQNVEDFSRRYRGAQLRHQLNRAKAKISGAADGIDGEPLDHETGLMELAHIATDAMFLLEMAVRKVKGLPTPSGA